MEGHNGAILHLEYTSDGERIISASTDKTVGVWDTRSGARLRRLKGHTAHVNSCSSARSSTLVASGSDDGMIRVWDHRRRWPVKALTSGFPVTAVCFSERADQIVSGGIDNSLKLWDLRSDQQLFSMDGHSDTPTDLTLSPNGSYILSNAMDSTGNEEKVFSILLFNNIDNHFFIF